MAGMEIMDTIETELLTQTTCPMELLRPDAASLLRTATEIVGGDRNVTHGTKRKNMQNTADLWSAYLGHKVTAEQVAWCMVLLKMSRTVCGTPIDDHYIDAAGYAGIAGEVR